MCHSNDAFIQIFCSDGEIGPWNMLERWVAGICRQVCKLCIDLYNYWSGVLLWANNIRENMSNITIPETLFFIETPSCNLKKIVFQDTCQFVRGWVLRQQTINSGSNAFYGSIVVPSISLHELRTEMMLLIWWSYMLLQHITKLSCYSSII